MSNMNLLLGVMLFLEQRAFKHFFAFVLMQMCACLKEHMQSTVCFALFAWFTRAALSAGIVKTAIKHAMSANARTQMWFAKKPFS